MKITGFEDIVSIDDFSYCLSVDKHEECRFVISVTDKYLKVCMNQLGNGCTMEDDNFKFSGTVTELVMVRNISGNTVEVKVQGSTVEYDREKRCRVFQNPEKKASDIFKSTYMSEAKYISDEDKVMEELIIQNHETDWNFIVRIANYLGKHVYPGERSWIGEPLNQTEVIEEEDIIAMKLILRNEESECTCRLKKRLQFGGRVKIQDRTFYVDTVRYEKVREEYIYRYHLKEYNNIKEYCELPIYCLLARVKENADPDKVGRVKVEFLKPYEDVMRDKAMWIQCDSIWASKALGVACVPFVEDIVWIQICDKDVRVQAARRMEAFDDRYEDCNTRYVFLDEKSYLSLNREKAVVKFDDTVEIEINENGIHSVSGESDIKMNNDQISIYTDKTNIEISDGTEIRTEKFVLDGKDKVGIEASRVDIQGKSGVSIN